jgi:hypothetical protein
LGFDEAGVIPYRLLGTAPRGRLSARVVGRNL